MNKLQNIQALRGVAALVVVLFHLVLIERKYGGANHILPDWLQFGMFGVDLFFVISGFVMVMVTRGKFQHVKNALIFLYHRASRIYPLYWVYTTLGLVVFLIRPTWVNSSQGNQVNILASYLLLPDSLLPLVQVGWTLIHEMYFYLVFFLLMLSLPERFLPAAMLVWGVLIAIFDRRTGGAALDLVFHPLTIEFIAGCLLAWHYRHFTSVNINASGLAAATCTGLAAAALGYVYYENQTGSPPGGWWRLVYYGIPAVVIVFSGTHAERNGMILPAFLIQNGNASYSIYLSHLFTINAVGRLWNVFASDGIVDNLFALLVTLAAVLAVGFASYWMLETPLLRLSRKLA
ncbi:MAG: acyltransferase [Chloroflexi bacterium]|nr:acyltransferase [Chloroflexota bacterium]